MTQTTPKVQSGTLVYRQDGQEHVLSVGTSAWFAWLKTATTFAFKSEHGTFTARKEQVGNKRGGWYWKAYRRRSGKLHRTYLGKSEELTLERLNAIAKVLAGQEDSAAQVPVGDQLSERTKSSSKQHTEAEQGRYLPKDRTQNLPVQLTSLIGREHEVNVASALLRCEDIHLLTLTGPGGVGKTRLALEIASNLLDDFADGIYFVPLASISESHLVAPTIAQRLGLRETADVGEHFLLEKLIIALYDKQVLLLLDNFEQVVTAAPILAELLVTCPQLKILVTSRAVLHIRGEHEFPVTPLALPNLNHLPDIQILSQYAAVKLFLQRVQAVQHNFQLTSINAHTIAEICVRLDGLPLTIELAAARIKLFPPQALLARLEHRMQMLTGGARDMPIRQQTLWNTLTWSYDLLNEKEQRLFRRLSVFVSGCTLEAVETVCRSMDNSALSMVEEVISLLDKSLLQQIEREGETPRLQMLETIREYGLERLIASGELEIVQQAHAIYYLALAEKAEPNLTGAEEGAWLERLEREHDNLRAAMNWSLEDKGVETKPRTEVALHLGGALWRFWWARGYLSEGRNFLQRALSKKGNVGISVRAKALSGAGMLAFYQDDYEAAEQLCAESVTFFRELQDKQGIATTLNLLGQIASWKSNYTTARSLVEEALALFREEGNTWNTASSLGVLASLAITSGEYERTQSLAEESLALFKEMGDKWGISFALHHLARKNFLQGNAAKARALGEESLALSKEVGDKGAIAYTLDLLAQIVLAQGDAAASRSLLEESLTLHKEVEDRWGVAQSLSFLAKVAMLQKDNASARVLYEQILTVLKEMGDKQLIASCLEGLAQAVLAQESTRNVALWATRLLGTAQSLRNSIGAPLPPIERSNYDRTVAALHNRLGDKAFKAAWTEGRSMTPEQVMKVQGQDYLPTEAIATYPMGLTQREVDVLRLVAEGLTDVQVAEKLVLSPYTVSTHLRSIYNKLGVASRSAATRFAVEQHLV